MSLIRDGYAWADVDTYAEAISARSQLRGWGLDRDSIESALSAIRGHKDVLHPTAITLSLGKGAGYDWAEANAWMADSLKEHGSKYFDDCSAYFSMPVESGTSSGRFHYPERSRLISDSEPELAPSYLDLERFHFKDSAIWGVLSVMDIINRGQTGRLNGWPGLDMLWLFALNSEMYLEGWNRWIEPAALLLPGIVLTDEESDGAARRQSSTSWGFIPMLEYRGPVMSTCHRSSWANGGMCFVSYASS